MTNQLPSVPNLLWVAALDHPNLVAEVVYRALEHWAAVDARVLEQVAVCQIDPDDADTATLTKKYDLPLDISANCVLVAGLRTGEERFAACVVPANTVADVNNRVRKLLDVRKASFLSRERAVSTTGQEYGGIGPIGLPSAWRLLVDSRFADRDSLALMGSGVRHSKLLMPGELLCAAPGAEIVEELGMRRTTDTS